MSDTSGEELELTLTRVEFSYVPELARLVRDTVEGGTFSGILIKINSGSWWNASAGHSAAHAWVRSGNKDLVQVPDSEIVSVIDTLGSDEAMAQDQAMWGRIARVTKQVLCSEPASPLD